MGTTQQERIRQLREMIPYLLEENNESELGRIAEELETLGCDIRELKDMQMQCREKADPSGIAEVWLRQGNDAYGNGNLERAGMKAERVLQEHPFSQEALYLKACVDNGKPISFSISGSKEDYTIEQLQAMALKEAVWSVYSDQLEMRHRICCALKDYSSARRMYLVAGDVELQYLKFEEAAESYRKALTFEKAVAALAQQEVYKAFDAEVDGLVERLRTERMPQLAALQKNVKLVQAYPLGRGWLSTLAFLFSFLVSVVLDLPVGDAEPWLVIGFSILFTLGTQCRRGQKFRILPALGILVLVFLMSGLLYDNMFLQLMPLFQWLPTGIFLNLASGIALAIVLPGQLRGVPGERALRQTVRLDRELREYWETLRAELLRRYSSKTDPKAVKRWVEKLEMPNVQTMSL